MEMLTNQDIVNIIEYHREKRERLSELNIGFHLASTKEEYERCLYEYNKLKEEYEQWLKEKIK